MRSLLRFFPKPSHYAGFEDGAVTKPSSSISLRIALAFPDTYEVGMSYLGQKILYGIINSHPSWQAERVFAPEREAAAILKKHKAPLSTLETGTPLGSLDAIGFSVTHELCYTDILYMLDLAHVPFRHANRPDSLTECPVIMGGGGAIMGAEAIAPFFDLICLGDGEELLPEVLSLLEKARAANIGRKKFLEHASHIPGIYVPSLFQTLPDGALKSSIPGYRPGRRIVADLDTAPYPVSQITPVGAIHNRLSLEIARGCTRGCRFCQAGILYRPCRERSLENIDKLLNESLDQTGFEEISFLSLSAGDFSAFHTLCENVWDRCANEHITLSLPSLRVGSVNDSVMAKIASLRRTGCTLAPEAGSQRLRDVINKGITEEQLLMHARKLAEHGWRQVKLYFMIGLPTETDDDLEAILDLCRKTRDAAGKGAPRLSVTASISPFVPKPFTPFQWEEQISYSEMKRRIELCRQLFKNQKLLSLHWHNPDSSHLEGLLSRADRRMADVVEKAYEKGAIFSSWAESFSLEPWLEALAECGLEANTLVKARELGETLPWDHLESGVSKKFLMKEREKALARKITPDCRYESCTGCGACDGKLLSSLLPRSKKGEIHKHHLVFSKRDQQDAPPLKESASFPKPARPVLPSSLLVRQAHYRVWHFKMGNYAFLSQLELQAVIFRTLRKAKLPVAFSQGFHPLPLISYGRALPVGVASSAEWFALTLSSFLAPQKLAARLNSFLPREMSVWLVEAVEKKQKTEQAVSETFLLDLDNPCLFLKGVEAFGIFMDSASHEFKKETKKGHSTINLRPLIKNWDVIAESGKETRIRFRTDWSKNYISPVTLANNILQTFPATNEAGFSLHKTEQYYRDGKKYSGSN